MVRGILMSKEGQKAILLTKDGTFQKVRLRKDAQVKVGQSVLDSDIALRPAVAKKLPMVLAACLTVVVVFSVISGFIRNNAIAAYVSFDVNPSIEAAINRDFRVVKVKALNDDGKALLDNGINYKDMPLEEFSLAIADALSERGYLVNQPDIVVSTIVTDKVKDANREGFLFKVNQAVKKVKTNQAFKKSNGSLEVFNTTMDYRHKAEKAGISTGKYLIYLKEEKTKGKHFNLSQVKQMTVKQLRQDNRNNKETVDVKMSHPKKNPNAEKKHKKQNDYENSDQKNDGELLNKDNTKVADPKNASAPNIKQELQNSVPGDFIKQNGHIPNMKFFHSNEDENKGPQFDSHKDNNGNDKKDWKRAG